MKLLQIIFLFILILGCSSNTVSNNTNLKELEASADLHFKDGDYKSAANILEDLIKKDSVRSAIYLYKLAVCKNLDGQYDLSSKDLLKSIEKGYNSKESYFLLAENTIKSKNDTAKALSYINQAFQIDPKDTSIIMYKLILMGENEAMKFTLDSLL